MGLFSDDDDFARSGNLDNTRSRGVRIWCVGALERWDDIIHLCLQFHLDIIETGGGGVAREVGRCADNGSAKSFEEFVAKHGPG